MPDKKEKRIFIIEDDRLTALDLRNTLRRIGYQVLDPVASGSEAVAKVNEQKPDLIITDISLEGDLDGIETVHRIQKNLDIPVIYFTAYSSPDMFKRALETNPYGYLVKPVSMDDLYTTIETALKRSDLERKLRISEIRFRLAFENAMDAMLWADAETGILIDCNRSAEWLFEMGRDEIVGRHFTLLHPPDFGEAIRKIFAEKAGGSAEPVEVRIITKNGAEKIVTINTAVTRMEEKTVVQGIFRDLSRQKEVEAALQLNQTRLQALVSLGQKAAQLPERQIIDLGLEEAVRLTRSRIAYLHFISADQKMVEYYAWSQEALRTCSASAGTHYPLDRAGIWADCAKTGKPVIHNDYEAAGWKRGLPEGHTPVSRHMSVPVADQNRIIMIIGVGNKESDYDESDVNMLELLAEDIWKIIERKRADDALRESEERYRALFEESPEPIIIFSIDGFVQNVNPAYETHTGYSRDETMGLNLADLPVLDKRNSPDYVAIYREILKTRQLHRMELPVIHRNGAGMFVEIFISPLMKNGRIAGFQIIARDISARKRLEQNLQWELSVNAALAHLSETIIRPEITIENMGGEVLEHAKRVTGSAHGYVGYIDPRTKSLVCHTLTAMMGSECDVAGEPQQIVFPANRKGGYDALWGHSLNTLKPFYTNAPREHPSSRDVPPGHVPLSNFLSVPAVAGNTLLGQVSLANATDGYTDRDLETVGRLADLYAMALQRLRYESELQQANELLEQRVRERTKKLVNEIEERVKAEIKLREGEEVARALINSPSEPVFLVSTDGTILDANAELEMRLRQPKKDIIGKPMFGFIDRASAARYKEKMEFVISTGKALRFENQLGGSWYDTVIYPVPDHQGAVTKLAVFAHDITETRRLQKDIMAISELERQRIGQDLHDGLGQKLTGIAFLAEALKGSMKEKGYPEVEDIEEIYTNIAESIDHARKISSGLWTTRLESYDAEKALRELADDTEILFGITCGLENSLKEPVVNSQVVINLYFICRESINNAFKHGGAGRIDITLSDDAAFLYLEIRDNGKGAPDAFRKKTGIGLRIMQYRAGIIGGTCSFENTRGGFIVRVAVKKEFIENYL